MPQQQNQTKPARVAYPKAPQGLSQSALAENRDVIKPKSGKRTPIKKGKNQAFTEDKIRQLVNNRPGTAANFNNNNGGKPNKFDDVKLKELSQRLNEIQIPKRTSERIVEVDPYATKTLQHT